LIIIFLDLKENIDTYIDIHSIWQCMKRINSNLDFLAQKFSDLKSDQVQAKNLPASDSSDFLLSFPLKKIEDVIELESRLLDENSHFYKKFVSFFFLLFIYIVIVQQLTQNVGSRRRKALQPY